MLVCVVCLLCVGRLLVWCLACLWCFVWCVRLFGLCPVHWLALAAVGACVCVCVCVWSLSGPGLGNSFHSRRTVADVGSSVLVEESATPRHVGVALPSCIGDGATIASLDNVRVQAWTTPRCAAWLMGGDEP